VLANGGREKLPQKLEVLAEAEAKPFDQKAKHFLAQQLSLQAKHFLVQELLAKESSAQLVAR
jgi:hypothetical protein